MYFIGLNRVRSNPPLSPSLSPTRFYTTKSDKKEVRSQGDIKSLLFEFPLSIKMVGGPVELLWLYSRYQRGIDIGCKEA